MDVRVLYLFELIVIDTNATHLQFIILFRFLIYKEGIFCVWCVCVCMYARVWSPSPQIGPVEYISVSVYTLIVS
jgi:hypothetical protein